MAEFLSEDTGSIQRVTKGCEGGHAAGKRVVWVSGRQMEGAPDSQRCASGNLKRLRPEGPTERAGIPPERKGVPKESLVAFHYGEKVFTFQGPPPTPSAHPWADLPLLPSAAQPTGTCLPFICSVQQGPLPAARPAAPFSSLPASRSPPSQLQATNRHPPRSPCPSGPMGFRTTAVIDICPLSYVITLCSPAHAPPRPNFSCFSSITGIAIRDSGWRDPS